VLQARKALRNLKAETPRYKKEVIMDFSEKGIERAFAWTSEDVSYSVQDSLRFYKSLKPPSNLIRDWLVDDRKHLTGRALATPNRREFYLVVSRLISMLSKVIGQKDDTKFWPKFVGFIDLINGGKGIRWSRVISDSLA